MTEKRGAPRIIAKLETDTEGRPKFVKQGDHKHYKISFEVENPPQDLYAATFELHETYYDPVRTIRPGTNASVVLDTTTYGDFDVKVLLRTKSGEIPLIESVSSALDHARAQMPSGEAVDKAISEIAKN